MRLTPDGREVTGVYYSCHRSACWLDCAGGACMPVSFGVQARCMWSGMTVALSLKQGADCMLLDGAPLALQAY